MLFYATENEDDDDRTKLILDKEPSASLEIAEKAADHFHARRDGWECTWPIKFKLWRDETYLGEFEVEREMDPVFYASPVKPAPVTTSALAAGGE